MTHNLWLIKHLRLSSFTRTESQETLINSDQEDCETDKQIETKIFDAETAFNLVKKEKENQEKLTRSGRSRRGSFGPRSVGERSHTGTRRGTTCRLDQVATGLTRSSRGSRGPSRSSSRNSGIQPYEEIPHPVMPHLLPSSPSLTHSIPPLEETISSIGITSYVYSLMDSMSHRLWVIVNYYMTVKGSRD